MYPRHSGPPGWSYPQWQYGQYYPPPGPPPPAPYPPGYHPPYHTPTPPSHPPSPYHHQHQRHLSWSHQPNLPPPPPQGAQHFGHGAPSHYHFQYSACTGRRRALLIGINYAGQPNQLRGCINDVTNMSVFLHDKFGYRREDMVILTDDQKNPMSIPTKANILRAMQWLVRDAQPNDSLFIHFSGHGGRTPDLDGDEDDGYDDVIYPLDYRVAGHIVDDDMHAIMVRPLRPGVRLTAIFDSCHSGTALDLPYVYSTQGVLKEPNLAKEAAQDLFSAINSYSNRDLSGMAETAIGFFKKAAIGSSARERTVMTKTSPADVVMFSGSKDTQTSADTFQDGEARGALSWAFINTLERWPHQSYVQLLNTIRAELEGRYTQKPQLSCSHPLVLSTTAIMHYSYSPTDSSRSLSSPESPSSSSTHYVWPVPASSSSPSHHRRRTTAPSPYYYYNTPNHSHTTSTTTTTSTSTSSVKSRRFYSSPLCEDSPDPKTPLQAYGLEQREPSIYELQLQQQQQQRPTPRLIRRMSTVLDDIKEDFHMQIDAHAAHDKQRLRRRESAFFDGPPVVRRSVGAGDSSPPLPPVSAVPPVEDSGAAPAPGVASRRRESAGARPLSVLSWENTWSLSRRFSRRLSMLGSSFSLRRKRMEASISQPNLIGSSTQM